MSSTEHVGAYVCERVIKGGAPVLLVSREDGEWVLLCEDRVHDDDDEIHVVGLNHLFDLDPSLLELLNMVDDEVAKRTSMGSAWDRGIVEFDDE